MSKLASNKAVMRRLKEKGSKEIVDKKYRHDDSDASSDESDTEQHGDHNLQAVGLKEEDLENWKQMLCSRQNALVGFRALKQAVHAIVEDLAGSEAVHNEYRFSKKMSNAVIMMCFTDIPNGLRMIIGPKNPIDRSQVNKRWKKYRTIIKPYLKDLIKLLDCMVDSSATQAILKHGIYPILDYFMAIASLRWQLVKKLALIWSTGTFNSRVLAFIGIYRICKILDPKYLSQILQAMYLSYVKNCKFTSTRNISGINFMRNSLVELYSLDHIETYKQAFVYVRQIAVHMRNAIVKRNKETMAVVLNWQTVHAIHMWLDMLARNHPSEVLQPLSFPVVQICLEMARFTNSTRHYPFVAHMSRLLIDFGKTTSTFIPVLPLALEMLRNPDLLNPVGGTTHKPEPWVCILKLTHDTLSPAQSDETIKQVYGLILEFFTNECHTIGFPELAYPAVSEIKTFVNKCKNHVHKGQMQSLSSKIRENMDFIQERRKGISFGLFDEEEVHKWEIETRQSSPPLLTLNEKWKKDRGRELEGLIDEEGSGVQFTPWSKILEMHQKKQMQDKADKILLADDEPTKKEKAESIPEENVTENDEIDFDLHSESEGEDADSATKHRKSKKVEGKNLVAEGDEVSESNDDDEEEELPENEAELAEEENFEDEELMSDDEEDEEEFDEVAEKRRKKAAKDEDDIDELASSDEPEDEVQLMTVDDLVFEEDKY